MAAMLRDGVTAGQSVPKIARDARRSNPEARVVGRQPLRGQPGEVEPDVLAGQGQGCGRVCDGEQGLAQGATRRTQGAGRS